MRNLYKLTSLLVGTNALLNNDQLLVMKDNRDYSDPYEEETIDILDPSTEQEYLDHQNDPLPAPMDE